jgi:hypothetical protein
MAARKKATAGPKRSAAEAHLLRAKLVVATHLTAAHRKKIAKLTPHEVKALVSARRKLGTKGSLHIAGGDIF